MCSIQRCPRGRCAGPSCQPQAEGEGEGERGGGEEQDLLTGQPQQSSLQRGGGDEEQDLLHDYVAVILQLDTIGEEVLLVRALP